MESIGECRICHKTGPLYPLIYNRDVETGYAFLERPSFNFWCIDCLCLIGSAYERRSHSTYWEIPYEFREPVTCRCYPYCEGRCQQPN
jgi:hypothetical protein